MLFYRGNDKSTEVQLCTYDDVIAQARTIYAANSSIRFLVQSDETEFIERMLSEFSSNAFCFRDEIRHISKNPKTSVEHHFKLNNLEFSKNFLAVTIIMSKCKYIIFGTGNCSLWTVLYRKNNRNIIQYNNGKWIRNIVS